MQNSTGMSGNQTSGGISVDPLNQGMSPNGKYKASNDTIQAIKEFREDKEFRS